ncbi:hypothetical protein LCGC14_2922120 [marine sediment metagenome]|uniref:Phage gp6-like head-tail connector protein n=1 Tax=marine sediment metagenome TaxID=412755 RepID=A0A0F8ZW45_9ZZZZ
MALTTITDLEAYLATTFTGDDIGRVTDTWLPQAQAAAEKWCNQALEHASVTEIFEVDQWESWHVLDRFPVTAITSVTEDSDLLTVTDKYLTYEDGGLRRVNGVLDSSWSMLPDAVTVVYTAGYGSAAPAGFTDTPAYLVLAIVSIAADLVERAGLFEKLGVVPIKSVQLEGSDTLTYAVNADPRKPGELTAAEKNLLSPYVRRKM